MAQFHAWQMQQEMPISIPGQTDPYPALNSRPEMLQVLLQRDEQIKEMLNVIGRLQERCNQLSQLCDQRSQQYQDLENQKIVELAKKDKRIETLRALVAKNLANEEKLEKYEKQLHNSRQREASARNEILLKDSKIKSQEEQINIFCQEIKSKDSRSLCLEVHIGNLQKSLSENIKSKDQRIEYLKKENAEKHSIITCQIEEINSLKEEMDMQATKVVTQIKEVPVVSLSEHCKGCQCFLNPGVFESDLVQRLKAESTKTEIKTENQ